MHPNLKRMTIEQMICEIQAGLKWRGSGGFFLSIRSNGWDITMRNAHNGASPLEMRTYPTMRAAIEAAVAHLRIHEATKGVAHEG